MDMETTRWLSDLAILCLYQVPFLQIFEEAVGRWQKEWPWTLWRRARGVQAGEEEDLRTGHCLQVKILD